MPLAIFVIEWDPFEGAIVTHQYPTEVEIDPNNVQTIDVTHQFQKESPWIVVEDKGIKAVSYMNEKFQKAIALLLAPNEVPVTFVKFLEQLSEFVLPVDDDKVPQRLKESFTFIQAEIPVNEIVLMDFAHQIEQAKEDMFDFKRRIQVILDHCSEISTKVLLFLAINDGSTLEKIEQEIADLPEDPASIESVLQDLVDKGLVRVSGKDGMYRVS
ncbi:MAG TPA: hypothetical protein VKM55_17375 [Candidatus Lokiarchaeia archaeon]|nr:hypothetical protein [Candidatus Lokiarchaeia archaeon]